MNQKSTSPDRETHLLLDRINQLRQDLKKIDPWRLAEKTNSRYLPDEPDAGHFELDFWGMEVHVSYPEFRMVEFASQQEPHMVNQALLLYYFHTADGTPPDFRWIAFTDLPDGMFYTQAFHGYTGIELGRFFRNDRSAFEKAARKAGGNRVVFGEVSFKFDILPNASLLVVFWEGDEDFPSSFQVLFDASISHYLPTDACAIAGSMLTKKLIASR